MTADVWKSSPLRDQWKPTILLATPVIIAELGWMAMAIVDTFMVGGLGPEAIGAVSVGGIVHFTVVIFGFGILLGLDTLVSQAFGAKKLSEGQRSLIQGLWMSFILTPFLMLIQWILAENLVLMKITPNVVKLAEPFMKSLMWSTLPLMIQGAFRRYLQALGSTRPAMFALVSANLVNWLCNWIFINGHLGFPALGVEGSGWSTTIARIYMAAVFILATYLLERGKDEAFWKVPLRLDTKRMLNLIKLGLPAAIQVTLEVGVFAVATTLAGRLDAESLAAHQIVLNFSSLTFMVPLAISSAGSVRVGHALGRGNTQDASSAGWAAIALGVGFMAVSAITMTALARPISAIFTEDATVLVICAKLMLVAAGFQLFDGLQIATTGALRGAGDTGNAMIAGLVAYWLIGLPIGAWLAFQRGWGVVGLWTGLSVGLGLAAVILLAVWIRQIKRWKVAFEAGDPHTHQLSIE
jgi:MATE family multidrug resistance protein